MSSKRTYTRVPAFTVAETDRLLQIVLGSGIRLAYDGLPRTGDATFLRGWDNIVAEYNSPPNTVVNIFFFFSFFDFRVFVQIFIHSLFIQSRTRKSLMKRSHNIRTALKLLSEYVASFNAGLQVPAQPPQFSFVITDTVKRYAAASKFPLDGIENTPVNAKTCKIQSAVAHSSSAIPIQEIAATSPAQSSIQHIATPSSNVVSLPDTEQAPCTSATAIARDAQQPCTSADYYRLKVAAIESENRQREEIHAMNMAIRQQQLAFWSLATEKLTSGDLHFGDVVQLQNAADTEIQQQAELIAEEEGMDIDAEEPTEMDARLPDMPRLSPVDYDALDYEPDSN